MQSAMATSDSGKNTHSLKTAKLDVEIVYDLLLIPTNVEFALIETSVLHTYYSDYHSSRRFWIVLQPENLPRQMNLSKRPFTPQQSRHRLILILRPHTHRPLFLERHGVSVYGVAARSVVQDGGLRGRRARSRICGEQIGAQSLTWRECMRRVPPFSS